MNESKRTSQVLKRFRELYPDGIAWKFNDRIARSRPDAMFLRKGKATFVEFKRHGNEPTAGQALELNKLGNAEFRVMVAWFRGREIDVAYAEANGIGSPCHTFLGVDAFCHFIA